MKISAAKKLVGDARSLEAKVWGSWLSRAARLTPPFKEWGDDPFGYNETTSVGFLSAAAFHIDAVALIDYGCVKGKREDRRQNSNGRGDLWLHTKQRCWAFEFKQLRPVGIPGIRTLENKFKEAMECARSIRTCEANRRVAGLIVSSYWIENWIDETRRKSFSIRMEEFAETVEYAWSLGPYSPPDEEGPKETYFFFRCI